MYVKYVESNGIMNNAVLFQQPCNSEQDARLILVYLEQKFADEGYEIKIQSDGNIQFYYYIKPESSSASNPYKAWITLSKDYKVIEEKYGVTELGDFETYKNQQKNIAMYRAVLYAMLVICLIGISVIGVIAIRWLILQLWLKISAKKKSRS